MTQEEIDARLDALEKMSLEESDPSTLATINRCYEKLLMMEPTEKKAEVDARAAMHKANEGGL